MDSESNRTLSEQLRLRSGEDEQTLPQQVRNVIQSVIGELKSSGITDNSLTPGDTAPDFALTAATGRTVRLSELLATGPVIVTFFRGEWCPYCRLELQAWQQALPGLQQRGVSLIAISPQTPEASQATAKRLGLEYDLLSDPGNMVARRFGLVYVAPPELRDVYTQMGIDLPTANGEDSFELPIPATFLVSPDRSILYSFVDTDYRLRADPAVLLASLAG